MSTITKEQIEQYANAARLIQVSDFDKGKLITVAPGHMLELARIALASFEVEAAYFINRVKHSDAYGDDVELRTYCYELDALKSKDDFGGEIVPVYTAPPAPVSLTEEQRAMLRDMDDDIVAELEEEERICRTSMLQGANNEQQRKASIHDALCEKYNVESLAEFVEWQRNHIAELEAAPPAPVGPGETAVMPDYPGYVMTQRECFQAGKKAGLAEAGKSPVIPDGWTRSDEANAALIMLDRIETVDSVDDDRIEGIKRIIRALSAAPQQEVK